MPSAITTTPRTTAPAGAPSQSGRVSRPWNPEVFQNDQNPSTVDPKAKIPSSVPRTNSSPSSFRVATATSDVPGQ
jgi:hypothetical protein